MQHNFQAFLTFYNEANDVKYHNAYTEMEVLVSVQNHYIVE